METLISLFNIVIGCIQLFCYEFIMIWVRCLVYCELGLLKIAEWVLGGAEND